MTTKRNAMRRLPLTAALASLMLVAGCSLAPRYERPALPVSERWGVLAADLASDRQSAAAMNWQSFVVDAQLRTLIETAIANNRDLGQTILNVEAARAQYRVQRADRLPGINAQADGSRQRTPADLSPSGQASVGNQFQAGLGLAAFEIDLFGRVRSLSEAALEEYLATEGAARSARISLIGEVIQAYLTRTGAMQRLELTRQTLKSREDSLGLIGKRRELGVGSALDFEEARALTEQARARLARTDREFRQSTNALGLLLGVSDTSTLLPRQAPASPVLVQALAAGTPSQLLTYRPDIQAAENRLRSRNASIGAARAAFFPRISLTGMFGTASSDISNLFESGQRAWSFAPQITLPIFSGGANVANLDLATVRKDIAVADYEKTIQVAFREVSDALAAVDTLRREEQAQHALANSNLEAQKLSEARYRGGVDGYLRYLDAQRQAFDSQTALIDVRTQRQVALATLFRSLGGGWQGQTEVTE